jgi:hypothetical protein
MALRLAACSPPARKIVDSKGLFVVKSQQSRSKEREPVIGRVFNRRINPRARLALVLLLLTVHAFLISVTHRHGGAAIERDSPAGLGFSSNDNGGSHRAPGSSDSSHCATCRVQRDFASGLRSQAVVIAFTPITIGWDTLRPKASPLPSLTVFSSRGPPSLNEI